MNAGLNYEDTYEMRHMALPTVAALRSAIGLI